MEERNSGRRDKKRKVKSGGNDKHRSSAPILNEWGKAILVYSWPVLVVSLLYILVQFCSMHEISWLQEWLPECLSIDIFFRPCVWGSYIALGVILSLVIYRRIVKWRKLLHAEIATSREAGGSQ